MFGLGGTEILIIGIIAFLLFGARKIPALGAGLGKGISDFKRAAKGLEEIEVPPASRSEPRSEPTQRADPEIPPA